VYVYIHVGVGVWTVGFYNPDGRWVHKGGKDMKIIRDEAGPSSVNLLLAEWGMTNECGILGCKEKATTLIAAEQATFGMCEVHYQEALAAGKWTVRLKPYVQLVKELWGGG